MKEDEFNFNEAVESLEGRARRLATSHEARMLGNDEVVGAAAKVVRGAARVTRSLRILTIAVLIFAAALVFCAIVFASLVVPREIHCTEQPDGNLDCVSTLGVKSLPDLLKIGG